MARIFRFESDLKMAAAMPLLLEEMTRFSLSLAGRESHLAKSEQWTAIHLAP